MRCITALLCASLIACNACADDTPISDAHTHYMHDVWDSISPEDAINKLKGLGITRALVSSASDDGTQTLYRHAPQLVIPSLSPYLKRGNHDFWMDDESVIAYIEERLAKHTYVAIGEFHIYGDDANVPVIKKIVQLARQHDLMLQVHSDPEAVRILFQHDPELQIIWAHAGFDDPEVVRPMLERYPNLWADLSVRRDIYTKEKGFLKDWKHLLIKHSDRFMLGLDTYSPERWLQADSIMAQQLDLLATLPKDVANNIRYLNGERIVLKRFKEKLQKKE